MSQEKYEGRNVIWESKTKSVLVIIISFVFVSMALYGHEKMTPFVFWGSLLFFGIGGLFMLYRLLSPKNIFVTYNSEIGKKIIAEREETFLNDTGIFEYDETGFFMDGHEKEMVHYDWNDIETVFGYKIDLTIYDNICVDLYTSDGMRLSFTEEFPGWFTFISKLSENIPSISIGWSIAIARPAFERNLTLLFDKQNRDFKTLEALYYKASKK